jgi:hypothetical protein
MKRLTLKNKSNAAGALPARPPTKTAVISLEKLAREYEARLKRDGEGFMLRRKTDLP